MITGPRSRPRLAPRAWEIAAAIAMLIMSSTALFPLLYAPAVIEPDEVVWLRYLWLPVYGLTVLLAAWNWKDLRAAAVGFVPTLALLALALASASWSIASDVTLRRWEALAFNALFAFYLAARFDWRELVRIIAASMALLAIGSLVMALAFPSIGIHTTANAGAWRGLWPQKNELGFMMVMGALSSLAAAVIDARWRFAWLVAALLCGALLILSRSGTSLLCLLLSASMLAALVSSRARPVVATVAVFMAGFLALALLVVVVTDIDLVFQVMGKDPTLTGRTDVWTAVMRRIAERPTLGYGYAAFWHDRFGPALLIRRETGWQVPSAHNGWLEVVLQLGWTGAALTAFYFAVTAIAAARRLFSRGDGFWAITYAAAFLLLSFSESDILRQNSLEWILFMATSTKLVGDLVHRARPARPPLAVVQAA